jgi:hypothetical protein
MHIHVILDPREGTLIFLITLLCPPFTI